MRIISISHPYTDSVITHPLALPTVYHVIITNPIVCIHHHHGCSGAQPPDTRLAPPEPSLNLPRPSSAVQIPQLRQSKTFAGLQVTRAINKRGMVRFLAISYLDTILQENSVKLQRLRQPPSSVPAQSNGQSQPPAERRTFITVLLAAEVFIPILYFNLLSPLSHLLSPFPPISFTSSSEELFHHLALPLSPRDHRLSAHRCTAPSLYPSHHHR